MGKGRTRRKGKGKKAYLKPRKTFYDNNSPYALKTRGPAHINIAALVRDPVTKRLIPVEYRSTQLHGKRGLTIARATGPIAVAIHSSGSAPTVIPKAQVMAKQQAMKEAEVDPRSSIKSRVTVASEEWQGLRRQGRTEFNRVVLEDVKDKDKLTVYSLELFFSGRKFFFYEEDLRKKVRRVSIEYSSRDRAMYAYENRYSGRLVWIETYEIPPPPKAPSSA